MEKVLYKCTTSPLVLKKRLYLRGSGKDSKDENQRFCHQRTWDQSKVPKPGENLASNAAALFPSPWVPSLGREEAHGEGN